MFFVFKLKNIVKLLITLAIIALSVLLFYWIGRSAEAMQQAEPTPYVLVVDPGHGGIDGGAVGENGLKESDINLDIALKMYSIAEFCGADCVLTRNSDSDELGGEPYSERRSLLARADIANSQPDAVLISIHQNTFPNGLPSGAEVMYAKTAGSDELGKLAQQNLVSQLDPSNRRVARPAPEELLLTSTAKCTAILAECGFMSNPDELGRLSTSKYRGKIAIILFATFLQFSEDKTYA